MRKHSKIDLENLQIFIFKIDPRLLIFVRKECDIINILL